MADQLQTPTGPMGTGVTGETEPGGTQVGRLAENLGTHTSAKTVYGEAVVRDGVTVIPVARVRYVFGGGGGGRRGAQGAATSPEQGGGAGGAVNVSPIGFITVTSEGSRYRPIRPSGAALRRTIAAFATAAIGLVLLRRTLRNVAYAAVGVTAARRLGAMIQRRRAG